MTTDLTISVADRVRAADTMTPSERLTAVLENRTPDRVPISFKTVDPYAVDKPRVANDPNYRTLTEIAGRYTEVFHNWNIDTNRPNHSNHPYCFSGSDEIEARSKTSTDGTETVTAVTTPAGTLTRTKRTVLGSTWETKPFIETEADLDIFLAHEWVPYRPDLDSFWREKERLGDGGRMRITVPDPIGAVAAQLPRETLYIWMMDRPELVDTLVERMFGGLLDVLTYLAESGVECAFQFGGAEYAAPPMASPELFDRYVGRFGPPMTGVLREHDCLPYLHCHSRVGALLERFCDMGFVATHPVEPPPMGDVTAQQFKDRVGGRLAMIGNIQVGDLMHSEDPESIRAWITNLIDTMGVEGGLIVSESATPWESPMPDHALRNYITLIEAAHAVGR